MCILSDTTLQQRIDELIRKPEQDLSLINPASIDIRIGANLKYEDDTIYDLRLEPYRLEPKEFVLVSTYEYIMVPDDCVVELKLKSTMARAGFDHSLAFHVDPGWRGVLTMEVHNMNRLKALELHFKQPFAQIIVHKLDYPATTPYAGKYQHAGGVEGPKAGER